MLRAVTFFYFLILQVILAEDTYDITSVYHVGDMYNGTDESNTVEVHLRTNARGLQINYGGRNINDSTIGTYHFPTFQVNGNKSFPWDTEGWEFEYVDNDVKFAVNNKLSIIEPLDEVFRAQVKGYFSSNAKLYMVIFSHETTLLRHLPDFYIIIFGYRGNSYIDHCTTIIGSGMGFIDFDGQTLYASCDHIKSFDMYYFWAYDTHEAANDFAINFSNGRLQIFANFKMDKVLDWKHSLPIQANYFSMSAINSYDNLVVNLVTPGLFTQSSKPIISPWFTADMDKLCVAVVAKLFVNLNITIENMTDDRFELGNIVTYRQVKWKVLHFISQVPDQLKGRKIRFLLTPTMNKSIKIQRISSCNEEGDVAVIRLPTTRDADVLHETALVTIGGWIKIKYWVIPRITFQGVNWCSKNPLGSDVIVASNGGCSRDSDFVCPPGFTGWECETACGSNRFGMDCEGICSVYSHECQGLRLCTPGLGCHCAPGYSGETCDENCEPGKYGNDCDQVCGHCEDNNICDIYTGHCKTCEPGYYPPYCKATYPVVMEAPEVSVHNLSQASVKPHLTYEGRDSPEMYQIQYRESGRGDDWNIVESDKYLVHNASQVFGAPFTVENLDIGKFYDVRVVLFTKYLNSYQSSDVPFRTFLSLCTIPDEVDYHIIGVSNTTAITISWDYKNTSDHWCPVSHYKIFRLEGRKWVIKTVTDTSFMLSNLLSGEVIKFKVKAYTLGGAAPFSEVISISTKLQRPGPVRYLTAQHKDHQSELISWNPPKNIGTEKVVYHLQCQCLNRIACASKCDPADSFEVKVSNAYETLYSLQPLTRYLITVSAGEGQKTSLKIGTMGSFPTEIVKPSRQPPIRTNNSVTVFWEPVDVCSGFLKGYMYQLYKSDDETRMLKEGFTRKPFVSFVDLSAQTEYFAQIFIKTFAGYNPVKYLQIKVSTSGTVSEAVQNLTVYKQGRSLIGIRWGEPSKIYGVLKSFTVSYGYDNDTKTETVPPAPCVAWPHLYCHTLHNLKSNKKYAVSVSARNTEISEDGTPTSVSTVTKEGLSGVPENLQVVNTTATSFAVSWKYPSLANGIIRSFLMSIEETEQYETDKCCEIYPLVETVVKEELLNYSVEVSGLHPASTYTVSLSAKTISIGPSVTLTIYTRPPSMSVQCLPNVSVASQQDWIWMPQHQLQNVNNTEIYQALIKGNILLVVMNSSSSNFNSGIEDEKLSAELKKFIQNDYYFAAEYNKADLTVIGTGENVETKWGILSNPLLNEGQVYSFAAVQISEYCGVYNIDIVFSSTFTATA